MEARNPGFNRYFIIDEQVMRFFNKRWPPDWDSVSTPVFLGITLGWLLPWTPFVLHAVWKFLKTREDAVRVSLYWGLGGMAFLSLSSSKMEYYSLPVLPAFGVLAGIYWDRLETRRDGRIAAAAAAVVCAASIAGLALTGRVPGLVGSELGLAPVDAAKLYHVGLAAFGSFAAATGIAAVLLVSGRKGAAFAAVTLGAAGFMLATYAAYPPLETVFSSVAAAKEVGRSAQAADAVVVDGEQEYEFASTVCFYAGRRVLILERDGKPILPVKFTEKDRFLISDAEFGKLLDSGRGIYFITGREPSQLPRSAGNMKKIMDGAKKVYTNR